MWDFALWGLVGAATNRALLFLEASQRVKSWPWTRPNGPGGGVYAVSQILHLGIATAVTAAVATTPILANGLVAFGLGAAAPVVVKKVSSYTLALLPRQPDEPESIGGAGDDE